MPTVRLARPLRDVAGGRAHVEVAGDDLGAVLADLVAAHPELGERVLARDGSLQGFVRVFVGEQGARGDDALAMPVGPDDVVTIVPAVAGGAGDGGGP